MAHSHIGRKQPAASAINAIVVRIEGCSPMYGMDAKWLIHAITARISEIRKTAFVGAFNMSSP
jgi:hypothetical protein